MSPLFFPQRWEKNKTMEFLCFPYYFPPCWETPRGSPAHQKWQSPSKTMNSMQPASEEPGSLGQLPLWSLSGYFWVPKHVASFLMCVHKILLLWQMKKLQLHLVAFPPQGQCFSLETLPGVSLEFWFKEANGSESLLWSPRETEKPMALKEPDPKDQLRNLKPFIQFWLYTLTSFKIISHLSLMR